MSLAGGGHHHRHHYHHHHHHHHHDNLIYPSPPPPPPFSSHLLEITILSAQDLHPIFNRQHMNTYATAWIHPDHKLNTRVDAVGHTNPSWNGKFVFRVDDSFLLSETSAVDIHVNATLRFRRDPIVGIVRVVISAIKPSNATAEFVALQVRRPKSLRPQGIINVGVALLDGYYIKNMPFDPAFVLNSASFGLGKRIESEDEGSGREIMVKLEKWKVDVSPERAMSHRRMHRRRNMALCCFGCGNVED